jgi:ATP-dependent Lon protease
MKISNELAEIIGIHIGDGCISINDRYSEYAILGDITEEKDYYDEILVPLYNKIIFKKILGREVSPKKYLKNGTYGIMIFDKKVVNSFLGIGLSSGSKLNITIPEIILKDKKYWRPFLRGLFDTDGTIYFNKNYSIKDKNKRKHNCPRIKLGLTSKEVIKEVYTMLKELGFNPYLKPPYKGKRDKNPVHSIMLQRIKDIEKFICEIGFNSSKHITKWEVYKKEGYCPPYTTIKQRYQILGIQKIYNK